MTVVQRLGRGEDAGLPENRGHVRPRRGGEEEGRGKRGRRRGGQGRGSGSGSGRCRPQHPGLTWGSQAPAQVLNGPVFPLAIPDFCP